MWILGLGVFWATGGEGVGGSVKDIYRVEGVVVKAGGFGIDQDFLFVVGELILEGAAACARLPAPARFAVWFALAEAEGGELIGGDQGGLCHGREGGSR